MKRSKTVETTGWDLYRDGVTQSMISKFIICRHRFWIRYVLGLSQDIGFSHRMEFGSMLHAGFEAFAHAKHDRGFKFDAALKTGIAGINQYTDFLEQKFSKADSIPFWRYIAVETFKIYCEYWKTRDAKRQYLFQEYVFNVPIELHSGRTVPVRGKIDELFKDGKIIILQENKCKGEVDDEQITTGLHHDLQTGLYLTAINEMQLVKQDVSEILYNVILRPNGGKWPLRQKKDESPIQFQKRIIDGVAKEPTKFFHRWRAKLYDSDLLNFKNRTLIPILEQIADWWDSISKNPGDPWTTHYSHSQLADAGPGAPSFGPNPYHFCRPFGVFDSLGLGNRGDYFEFITSSGVNKTGLEQRPLFQELLDPSLAFKADSSKPKKQRKSADSIVAGLKKQLSQKDE